MNILIDELPNTVKIEGIEYEINSDFRTSILFELLMQDDEINEENKILQALNLYYPKIPHNLEGAIERILWFYKGGKDLDYVSDNEGIGVSSVYSFEYDDEYIYSAFLDQYGIDLQDVNEMHWWKFKAMFKSLKKDNEIVKIIEYRGIEINNNMSKGEKEFYQKMKKIHAIPKSNLEQEKIHEIEKALMVDGNLSEIVY